MNEPRVIESVTNECQSLGRAHESSSARAEQLIACLEGEIAKRDEELAACRIAVENCDLFRARIAELEDDLKCAHSMLCEVSKSGMVLRAELSAIKAQDTIGEVVGWYRLDRPYEMTSYPSVCAAWHKLGAPVAPLYAAPVSEAKAQGVVMLDEREAFEAAMRTLPDLTGAIDYALQCFDPGQDRYYMEQGCSGLELNSLFVVWSMARAALAAHRAQGLVAVEWAKDAEEWGPALNEAGWLFLSELNEDQQKSALIFNNCKGPLRAAIMKYAEIVTAHRAKGVV